jgi:stage III sporulation protein AG
LILLSSVIDFGAIASSKDAETYSQELKAQLLDIVSEIDGVGQVKVFLTMDNSGENVYLTNSDTKTKSIEPTVRGVVIVCDGGDDPVVADRVLGAVTRSLSISSDKVYITKLNTHD